MMLVSMPLKGPPMRFVRALTVAAACLIAVSGRAATWDMPSPYADEDFRTRSAQAFAEMVGRASEGQLTLVVFGNGKLVGGDQIDAAVRSNRVPIALYDLARLGDSHPLFSFSALPFLAATYTDSLRLWNAALPTVRRRAGDLGLMILYALPSPPAALFSKQPLATVTDLKGTPVVAADPWLSRLAVEIGAQPVDAASADLPRLFAGRSGGAAAMRAAMFAPFGEAVRISAWRLVNNAYDVQASFPLAVVVVNKEAFYALDEGSQRSLLNAAVDAQNAAWSDSVDQRNANIVALNEKELIVQPSPPALQDGLKRAAQTLVGDWTTTAGPDGQAILSAYGGPSD
jgi:TRAP-type C4-dicarboxylate transport system substrate-binding protein